MFSKQVASLVVGLRAHCGFVARYHRFWACQSYTSQSPLSIHVHVSIEIVRASAILTSEMVIFHVSGPPEHFRAAVGGDGLRLETPPSALAEVAVYLTTTFAQDLTSAQATRDQLYHSSLVTPFSPLRSRALFHTARLQQAAHRRAPPLPPPPPHLAAQTVTSHTGIAPQLTLWRSEKHPSSTPSSTNIYRPGRLQLS